MSSKKRTRRPIRPRKRPIERRDDAVSVKRRPEVEKREGELLPADELFRRALQHHRSGQLLPAEDMYKQLLEVFPEHPDVLHFLGVATNQLGRPEEALELIEKSLVFAPEYADAHANRALVLLRLGRLEDAERACHDAMRRHPGHLNARVNLGVSLNRQGRTAEAEKQYREVVKEVPTHAEAIRNLCLLLDRTGRHEESVKVGRDALALSPDESRLYANLSRSLRHADRVDEALKVLRQWLVLEPDNLEAKHLLCAFEGRTPPTECSKEYVEELFDDFAPVFDEVLELLEYSVPNQILEYLRSEIPNPAGDLRVLDAGCGTGLCAEGLRPFAKRLLGIDLSSEMLGRARSRKLYDELRKEDLVEFLNRCDEKFDMIVAADVMIYFGDLQPFLESVRGKLAEGGVLVFSLEQAEDEQADYHLELSGRFSHSRAYLQRVIPGAGFAEHEIREMVARNECNKPVSSFMVIIKS